VAPEPAGDAQAEDKPAAGDKPAEVVEKPETPPPEPGADINGEYIIILPDPPSIPSPRSPIPLFLSLCLSCPPPTHGLPSPYLSFPFHFLPERTIKEQNGFLNCMLPCSWSGLRGP
jgi:hypothetical protein